MPLDPRRVSASVGRAAPSVIGAAAGIALCSTAHPWAVGAGSVLFVGALPLRPREWAGYVRTGARDLSPAPEYAEPGRCAVHLVSAGDRPIQVVKALRETTALRFEEAKSAVGRAGQEGTAPIVARLSVASALRVKAAVVAAGADARVEGP